MKKHGEEVREEEKEEYIQQFQLVGLPGKKYKMPFKFKFQVNKGYFTVKYVPCNIWDMCVCLFTKSDNPKNRFVYLNHSIEAWKNTVGVLRREHQTLQCTVHPERMICFLASRSGRTTRMEERHGEDER